MAAALPSEESEHVILYVLPLVSTCFDAIAFPCYHYLFCFVSFSDFMMLARDATDKWVFYGYMLFLLSFLSHTELGRTEEDDFA